MKKMVYQFFLAITMLALAGCGGDSSSTAGKTTLLVYMEGTNLETGSSASASKNIAEMLAANYSPDTTIALATGAAYKDSSGLVSSWKTVKYHVVRNKVLVEVNDLGNVDMGTSAQLTEFIEWGQKTYPADRYILVFWDHGGGPFGGFGGYSSATLPKGYPYASNLTVAQIREVVKANVAKTGKKFELIGFDACLMGTLEIANSFKDTAKFMVASQDLEAGAGWDWTAMMNYIVANPGADGANIGKAIAKSFFAKLVLSDTEEDKASATATISVIDIEKIKPLNEALAAFSKWQQKLLTDGGTDAWYTLAYSRSKTMDFYTSDIYLGGSGDTVDILDLIDNIQIMSQEKITTDDGLMFEQLKKAVQSAVVYNQAGAERVNVSGLSMMFPTYTVWSNGDSGASYDNLAVYGDIVPDPVYSSLITDYSTRARNIKPITIANPVDNGSVITAAIDGAGPFGYEMAYIAMTGTAKIDDTDYTYYYGHQPIWSATKTLLSYGWDKWMTLSGKIVSVLADPVLPDPLKKPNVRRLRIPLEYKGVSGFYYLDYDIVKNEVDHHLGFMEDMNKQVSRGFTKLPKGATVTRLHAVRENTDKFPFTYWQAVNITADTFTLDWTGSQDLPTFGRTTLSAGTYNLAFTLYDLTMRPSYTAKTNNITKVVP